MEDQAYGVSWSCRSSRSQPSARDQQSTRSKSGAPTLSACSAWSTTRSTFCLVLPALTLTTGFAELRWLSGRPQTTDLAVGVRPRGVDADRLWPGRHSHQHPWTVGGCLAWLLYLSLPGPRMICMRASDLPAAAPHSASQHPISLSSIRPATCSCIERSEVPRCPPNGPTIDGKDGVAGSIPAGGSAPALTSENAGRHRVR